MHIDRNEEWIREGLLRGTILIAHDGSFMHEESLDICSAAVIMYCSSSNQWAKISVAEYLESANNFHSKLLGAVAVIIQYILQAAAADLPGVLGLVCLYFDNQGVIAHENMAWKLLPDKQALQPHSSTEISGWQQYLAVTLGMGGRPCN
jgi:hypothetical protein